MHAPDHPIESTASFGRERNLVGTITRPAHLPDAPAVAVVLLNAGVIGRAGPHRINVRIARALAQVGIPSIRFDLSGLGDSTRPSEPLPYEQQAIDDIRQAMDHLGHATGAKRFGLVGFCSGSDHGHATAVVDPRLRDLLLFDPYPHPTRLTHLIRLLTRAREMNPWQLLRSVIRVLSRQVRQRLGARPAAGGTHARPASSRPTPERAAYAETLCQLLADQARIRMVYSGSGLYWYNHASQFHRGFAAWPALQAIPVDHLPFLDHTLGDVRMQNHFVDLVRNWFARGSRAAA